MKKVDFKKLVISQELSSRLHKSGLHNIAVYHWYNDTPEDETKWEVSRLQTPTDDCLPAWTLEEVQILLGHFFVAPQLPEPKPREVDIETVKFHAYYPESLKTYDRGAEAAGEMLEYLIKHKQVIPHDANRRYNMAFKPE